MIVELRERVTYVRKMIEANEDEPEPQTMNILRRLQNLVDQANRILEEEKPDLSQERDRVKVEG